MESMAGRAWLPSCQLCGDTDPFVPSGPYNKLYGKVHSLVQEMPSFPDSLTSAV